MNASKLVRDRAATLVEPTARDIADAVAGEIMTYPDDEQSGLIADLAVYAVRSLLSQTRSNATTAHKRAEHDVDPSVSPSRRFERRRSAWQRMLAETLLVGGVYKPLGECGVDDFAAAIRDREEQMARIEWHVTRFGEFIAAIRRHNVGTLGELPEGAIDEAALVAA